MNYIRTKDLVKNIKVLMITRLILVTFVMVTGSLVLSVDKVSFYSIIAVFYFVTFIYTLFLRYEIPVYFNAYFQIIADIILGTFIIYYAGGADSIYALLYVPSIVASGIIISDRAAKTVAGLSSVFYSMVSIFEYFGILTVPSDIPVTQNIQEFIFLVSFRVIIFCFVGYLSSYLSHQLYEQRTELQKLKNLSEIILKSISSGVLTLDSESKIVYANAAAGRIFNKKNNEFLNYDWANLFFREPSQARQQEFLAGAKSDNGIESEILRPDGTHIILRTFYRELMDERDSIIGSVITFMDITLLKDFEIELRQREKLGAMGEMAISIAHEIRNPMAAIRGALEVLQEKGKLRDEGEKLIEVVFKETDRLNHIVEDFLKYAKEKELNVRYEDIWKLIDEVWLLIRQSEKWNANIKLEKKLNKARFIIKIDPDRIKQVFYNLFINSMDAMPFGGKIYVDINDIGDKTTIIVKDTGLGMPKDRLNNIFRSYYSTKKEGLGVGLKISKRIIESHKGSIELQSKEGEGTAVIIILPK